LGAWTIEGVFHLNAGRIASAISEAGQKEKRSEARKRAPEGKGSGDHQKVERGEPEMEGGSGEKLRTSLRRGVAPHSAANQESDEVKLKVSEEKEKGEAMKEKEKYFGRQSLYQKSGKPTPPISWTGRSSHLRRFLGGRRGKSK